MTERERKLMEELGLLYPADTVPVVRCKDCKNWLTVLPRKEAEYGFCMTGETLVVRKKDFFCADGDRRADDEES